MRASNEVAQYAAVLLGVGCRLASAVSLSVATSGGNASSSLLYGLMFEDINYSGDGGIHGQLLRNDGFQGDDPGLTAYGSVGGTTLAVDTSTPLTAELPQSLSVTVANGTAGLVGFENVGYWGIPVIDDTYTSYFFVKGDYIGDLQVQLVGNSTGTIYAQTNVSISSSSSAWSNYTVLLDASAAPDGSNTYQILFDAAAATSGSLNFGLPQLFGTTFKKRYNGLRNDVATAVDAIGGSFLRFPGGNNLEGSSVADRWIWNNTIGPVEHRPGRQGDWTYPNTDALGLMEYMQWCIDMDLTPVLAVWSGLTLEGGGVVTGDALDPYIQEALNELEFLLGDTSTTWGALRAEYGHPDPYSVEHVEIGNEDNLSAGCSTYASRFTAFYDAIHAAYPDLIIIASTTASSCLPSDFPPDNAWSDIHHYLTPKGFVSIFNEFDNWSRDWPIFVGEYASTTGNDGSTTYWSYMQGSCAEAVYMIGLERNSDIVKMASFAPLLEHFDHAQWSPDLMGLDSDPGSVTGSTSYYVQQMFASNRGTTIRAVTSDSGFGPVYWVASINDDTGVYYVKLSNYGNATESVAIAVNGTSGGTLTLLSGAADESNYPAEVNVSPVTTDLTGSGSYNISMPAWSVAVVALS